MAFWDDVGNFLTSVGDAVASGAEAVGDAVETGVNAAGEVVADVVETMGNGVQDGLNAVGGLLSGIPVVGGFLGGVCAWLGGIVAGVGNLIGAIVKGVLGIVGGVIGGIIKVLGGILTLHGDLIIEGLIDIGSSIAGAVISIVGTALSLVQRVIPFINNDRALTKEEKAILGVAFQRSLALYNIRIKFTSWIPTAHFTLDNTIYSPNQDLTVPLPTLVHECVHVWQYQNLGPRYTAEALGAQAVYGRGGTNDAYNWVAELNRGNNEWEDFNREAQAELIQEIWSDGSLTSQGTTNTGNGAFFDKQNCEEQLAMLVSLGPTTGGSCTEEFLAVRDGGNDHTPLANAAVKKLREAWNFRPSQII